VKGKPAPNKQEARIHTSYSNVGNRCAAANFVDGLHSIFSLIVRKHLHDSKDRVAFLRDYGDFIVSGDGLVIKVPGQLWHGATSNHNLEENIIINVCKCSHLIPKVFKLEHVRGHCIEAAVKVLHQFAR
jgi:hypothetical protein